MKKLFETNGFIHVKDTIIISFELDGKLYYINPLQNALLDDCLMCKIVQIDEHPDITKNQITEFKRTYTDDYGKIGQAKVISKGNFLTGQLNGENILLFNMFGELFIYNTEKFLDKIEKLSKKIIYRSERLMSSLQKRFLKLGAMERKKSHIKRPLQDEIAMFHAFRRIKE